LILSLPQRTLSNTLLDQELKKAGWSEDHLSRHRKGDRQKVRMALRLRRETTMTLGCIAGQLQMGTKTHLSHLLYLAGEGQTTEK
jgi:hypothetical protein